MAGDQMADETLTSRVNSLMAERSISNRQELARITRIKYHRLNSWWRQDRSGKANANDVAKLAEFFGVPTSYLLAGKPPRQEVSRHDALVKRMRGFEGDTLTALEKYVDFLSRDELLESQNSK
jgi:transcriptional regulator with XRE-family HTH domain